MEIDIPMMETSTRDVSARSEPPDVRNFTVAVDFGTTFSSVSYVGYTDPKQRRRLGLQQIETITSYPDNPYRNQPCHDVPTELWYSHRVSRPGHSQRSIPPRPLHTDEINSDESDEDDTDTDTLSTEMHEVGDARAPSAHGDDIEPHIHWGYQVQEQLRTLDHEADISRHLSRFKLMLDESEHTAPVRNNLVAICDKMKSRLLINESTDIIADYLEQLFRHTKKRLLETEGYTNASTIEFVLCIPAVWKSNASRKMQNAMSTAIERSKFGTLKYGSIDNLFLVSEPEAAAACVLASDQTRLKVGDTFLMLDAGGGTVDAVVYTIDNDIVLRLKREEVPPGGDLCGSSFINENFENFLRERLRGEEYLEEGGKSIPQIIDSLVIDFERRLKPNLDSMFPDKITRSFIDIPGLRENKAKRFLKGKLKLRPKDIKGFFHPLLTRVAEIMKSQLQIARAKQLKVKKVILIGGFGQSEALRAHLRQVLEEDPEFDGENIMLDLSTLLSTAVSRGAVLRALRKEEGPQRILQTSYGFLRAEPYGDWPAHATQQPKLDKHDGREYIFGTIDWVLNKGELLASEHIIRRQVEYTFRLGQTKDLSKTEFLYASDHKHESHYGFDHKLNQGADIEGYLVIDFTKLRKRGKLETEEPTKPGMMRYWKAKATLVVSIIGRNLRYEVWFPDEAGKIINAGQVPIAAAFELGTE